MRSYRIRTETQKRAPDLDHDYSKNELAITRYIAKRLRQGRKLRAMALVDVAEQLGVTYQTVRRYEAAENRLTIGRLETLANVLDLPFNWFLPPNLRAETTEPEPDGEWPTTTR